MTFLCRQNICLLFKPKVFEEITVESLRILQFLRPMPGVCVCACVDVNVLHVLGLCRGGGGGGKWRS
jgi:hypothetical protein